MPSSTTSQLAGGTIAEVTGREVPVEEALRRSGDPAVLVASTDRAREVLGWTPVRDLHAMVADAWGFQQAGSAPG